MLFHRQRPTVYCRCDGENSVDVILDWLFWLEILECMLNRITFKIFIRVQLSKKVLVKVIVCMMTSSNGNIFRVTGPLCGKFTGPGDFPTQRPVTRSFDVFFDLRLNKRLSKQPWGWWFEPPSWSLWRHRNVTSNIFKAGPTLIKFLDTMLCI